MILYYSGPGNTRYVAREVAKLIGEQQLLFIPELARRQCHELTCDDALGIFFPVYAWAAPRLVTDYIARVAFSRKPSYIYMVCTAGDEAGLTEQLFRRELRSKGLSLDAAFSVIMPETYINLPGFVLDTDERARRKIADAEPVISEIAAAVAERRRVSHVFRGSCAFLKSRIVNPLFYRFIITDSKFRADESCIGCGRCEHLCPLGNIALSDGRPVWRGNCTNCMACYHGCPEQAIHFGRQTDGKGQYSISKYL